MVLPDKQEAFVQGLIRGLSQREAYKQAYPNSIKWQENTIDSRASKLFKNYKVNTRYNELHDRLIKESEDECIVDAKKVLEEIVAIAFANFSDYAQIYKRQAIYTDDTGGHIPLVNEDGTPVMVDDVSFTPTSDLTKLQQRAIESFKVGKNGIELKLCSKDKALELLGRHLGMFKDKVEVSGLDAEKNKLDNILKQMRGDG